MRTSLSSYRLAGAAHASTIASVRELVREMNSYYSNRIEGQHTHPANIKRALRQDCSDKPETAKLQRLALVHIEAERELERSGMTDLPQNLASGFLQRAHAALYSRLSEERTGQPMMAELFSPVVSGANRSQWASASRPQVKWSPVFLPGSTKSMGGPVRWRIDYSP